MRDKEKIMGKGKKGLKISPLDDTEARECAGKSLREMLEDRLDEYIDELMDEEVMENLKGKEIARLQGCAQGLCEALAIIIKPYYPNPEMMKSWAMERYDERNA